MDDTKTTPTSTAGAEADEMQNQQKRTANMVKYGVLFVFCALIAPVAYFAITGLVGLLAFAAVAFIGYNVAPVVAQKVANAKYRALDSEKLSHISQVSKAAAADPIGTATAQSIEYKKRAAKFLEAITAYSTEVNNFETMMGDFSKKYPETAPRYKAQFETMKKALAFKNEKYKVLMENIRLMDDKILFLKANWNMSQALIKVNALGGLEGEDPMEQLKADSAITAVVNSINRAFAELDSAALADSASKDKPLMSRIDASQTAADRIEDVSRADGA